MSQSHPPPERLTAYLLGKLTLPDRQAIESHVRACANCRSTMTALSETADIPPQSEGTSSTVDFVAPSTPKIVAGCVLLEDQIILGGLGAVCKAYHPVLKDFRAIKRPHARTDQERERLGARFRREVEAVGLLRHDHVVRAYDAGTDEDGPFLVMEFLDGASFSNLLETHGRLPSADACELVRQTAIGLQAAHERGLVHRDIKPSNLMLARVDRNLVRVVIIDWGLVKRKVHELDDAPVSDDATVAGVTMGTPDFIAPEQALDARSVDTRADIYSLGATLYCLLAGKPPFHGRTKGEKLAAHQTETFPPLESIRNDIPVPLRNVIERMTAKNANMRFATPVEVATALKPFCTPEPQLIRLLDGPVGSAPKTSPHRVSWVGWSTIAGTGLACLLAIASLGVLLMGKLGGPPWEPATNAVLGAEPKVPERMAERHPGHCASLTFLADGLHAASESGGGSVFTWDLAKRRKKTSWLHVFQQPDKHKDLGGNVAASPDGKHLVAGGLNAGPPDIYYLSLYDQHSFELQNKTFTPLGKMGHALAFSPDSSLLATVSMPGEIAFWQKPGVNIFEVPSGKTAVHFPTGSPLLSLAFQPDGRSLLGGAQDGTLRLWRLKPHALEREFIGAGKRIEQVGFSANGKRVYSASRDDTSLLVWNNDADDKDVGKQVLAVAGLKAHTAMTCVAFWKGGRAFTGHAGGEVVLWDLEHGKTLYQFTHPQTVITAVAISPDGHHALAALSDLSVVLHRLPTPRGEAN